MKLNLTEKKVLNFLEKRQESTTKEISKELVISDATTRRALDRLNILGIIDRMHGGAQIRTLNTHIRNFSVKDQQNHQEKKAIAAEVAKLIKKGDLVFLNSGSTIFQIPRFITSEEVHLITNNIQLSNQIKREDTTLSFLGGVYDHLTRSCVGDLSVRSLDGIFSSLTILGTNGVHVNYGLTSSSPAEVAISKAMIKNTVGKVVVIADHSKINQTAHYRVCHLEEIDILVTDAKTPQKYIDHFREKEIQVIIA